ncbi:MAG TPA: porin [Gammaproteobacteria bacterium]|nr:porin [Gammaproteobacteria bacterium]HBG51297.1 porin [Gammaproteobacteria bacterium]
MGSLMVLPGAALADVKVYGRFNVGLDGQKDEIGLDSKEGSTTWRLQDQNNSSRLGFKGSHDIGMGDMSVIYQLEYGTNPDGSESDEFSERNIFMGLQGAFGTAKVGKFDTPVKEIGSKADQFNDESIGDITNLMVGETRANNMIQYNTPKLGNLVTLTAAVAPGEGREALDNANDEDNGVADTYYASAELEQGPFYAAVAYAGDQAGSLKFDGSTVGVDILRATVAVELMEALEIGALYQQAKGIDQDNGVQGGDAEETSWLGSIAYSYEAFKFKVQYGQTSGDQTDIDRTELAVGIDYKLSKALTAQAYYVTYEDEGRTVGGIDDPQTDSYGLGLVFKF